VVCISVWEVIVLFSEWKTTVSGIALLTFALVTICVMPEKYSDPLIVGVVAGGVALLKARDPEKKCDHEPKE
jgi:hypothetical protein